MMEQERADTLFWSGNFAEAERLYAEALVADPENFRAIIRLGYIALLANRLDEARTRLAEAIELRPKESEPRTLLAEVHYRRDDFQQAALLLSAIGEGAKTRKLRSFEDLTPYEINGGAEVTSLEFVLADPLPVVQVRVNGSEPANFFIDTGGAEVLLDADFAKEVGAAHFEAEAGTFAGGEKAEFQHGRVDTLTLNDFIIKNVPVHIMDIGHFSRPPLTGRRGVGIAGQISAIIKGLIVRALWRGKRLHGVIGTVLLYHFISTIDYPNGELILRRRNEENLTRLESEARARDRIEIPFWMAGDHYMVALGTVNRGLPLLFFVDTGLAGKGFACPESTLEEAGIQVQESRAGIGIGGAGAVKAIPFIVDDLTLGDAKEHSVKGLYMGTFPLENAFEFRIGGLISHEFFKPYALTLDFAGMRYVLEKKE